MSLAEASKQAEHAAKEKAQKAIVALLAEEAEIKKRKLTAIKIRSVQRGASSRKKSAAAKH